MRYATAFICLLLCIGPASASPFYFQTALGTDGDGRGSGRVDLGVEVFDNGTFGFDIEAGYTHLGVMACDTVERTYTIDDTIVEIEPTIPPPLPARPKIEVPYPVVPGPIKAPPPIVVDIDIPIDPPIDDIIDVGLASVPGNVSINGKQLKQYLPKFRTDIYSVTANPRVRIGNFMWLNFKIGVERKKLDGTLKEKGSFLDWKSDEKFSDAEVNYVLGGGAMFTLRDRLKGVLRFDYRDEKNWLEGNELPASDFIYSAGLRFGF